MCEYYRLVLAIEHTHTVDICRGSSHSAGNITCEVASLDVGVWECSTSLAEPVACELYLCANSDTCKH